MINPITNSEQPVWKSAYALEQQFALPNALIASWYNRGLIPATAIREPGSELNTGRSRLFESSAIQHIKDTVYKPMISIVPRAILVPTPDGNKILNVTPEPLQVQVLDKPIILAKPLPLPEGFLTTQHLMKGYLDSRTVEVKRGTIAEKTWKTEELWIRKWTGHATAFPWSQLDVDSYQAILGNAPSAWHGIRYLKAFTRWILKRYPQYRDSIPDVVLHKQTSPLPDVKTIEETEQILAIFKQHSYTIWALCMAIMRTGGRGFELREAEWETTTHTGFQTKGRAKKTADMLYFPEGLYDFLKTLPEPHTGTIFKNTAGRPYKDAHSIHREMERAFISAKQPIPKGIGVYFLRHLFAQKMKDLIPPERLATMMRTSVEELQKTYGKHTDDSFISSLNAASKKAWGERGTA